MIVLLRCLCLVGLVLVLPPRPVGGAGSNGPGKSSSAAAQTKAVRQARSSPLPANGATLPKRPGFMAAGVRNTCPAGRLAAVVPAVRLPDGFKEIDQVPLTTAEAEAIGPSSQYMYQYYFGAFKAWADRSHRSLAARQVEMHLLEYVNQLWTLDRAANEADQVVAAARHFIPGLAGKNGVKMPRVERALKGFRRARPSRSRHPLPLEAVAGLCNYFLDQCEWIMACLILVSFLGYLRPGEALKARKQDLVAPTSGLNPGLRFFGLIIAPQERPWEPCKTKEWDDTVLFDHPSWIGRIFSMLLLVPGEFLFPICVKKFNRLWKAAILFLGLPANTVAYQLRHGGASEDCLSKRRSIEGVMVRGRWKAMKNVRRYTKPGQVQKLLNNLPVKSKRHCTECARNLELLLSKRVKPLKLS